jgi:Protein of unknown function (DUF3037)
MEARVKVPYTFSILRYVHDPVTTEFANIGVALYAPEAKYASAICTSHYGRLSKMFGQIDGERFRQITRYLQSRIEQIGEQLRAQLPFPEVPKNIEGLLARVLPPDDSAIQFSSAGGGVTSAPEKTSTNFTSVMWNCTRFARRIRAGTMKKCGGFFGNPWKRST